MAYHTIINDCEGAEILVNVSVLQANALYM